MFINWPQKARILIIKHCPLFRVYILFVKLHKMCYTPCITPNILRKESDFKILI